MFRMICATGLLAAFLFSLPAGFAGTPEPGKRANYYKLKVTLTEAGRSIDMPVLNRAGGQARNDELPAPG